MKQNWVLFWKIVVIVATLHFCSGCSNRLLFSDPPRNFVGFHWHSDQVDLYINDQLQAGPDFAGTYAPDETIEVKYQLKPETGWAFSGWSFKWYEFPDATGTIIETTNPFRFKPDNRHSSLTVSMSRFDVESVVSSIDSKYAFFTTRTEGKRRAFLYDNLGRSTVEVPFDPLSYCYTNGNGDLFAATRDQGKVVTSLFDWSTATFVLFDDGLPDSAYGHWDTGQIWGSYINWAPDKSRCAYIDCDWIDANIKIYDKINRSTISVPLSAEFEIHQLMWDHDSSSLFAIKYNKVLQKKYLVHIAPSTALVSDITVLQPDELEMLGPDNLGNFYYFGSSEKSGLTLFRISRNVGINESVLPIGATTDEVRMCLSFGVLYYIRGDNVAWYNGSNFIPLFDTSQIGLRGTVDVLTLGLSEIYLLKSSVLGANDLYLYAPTGQVDRLSTVEAMK